jgi:hypothetical protein
MVKVSAGTLTKYREMAEKAMNRIKSVRERGEAVMETATRTAIVGTTSLALGVIQGKTGGVEILGLPLDLLIGAGAHAAGFMKLGGKNSAHLHNVGDGALALYAGTMGRAIGANWKATGKLGLGGAKVSGMLPEGMSGADTLSDQELAAAVLRR